MSKLNKYLKSIAGGKAYEKLAKSIAKECGKYSLLDEADLSSVAGGDDYIRARALNNSGKSLGDYYVDYIPNSGESGRWLRKQKLNELNSPLKRANRVWEYTNPSDGTRLSDADLNSVAGGASLNVIPLKLWEDGIQAEGYTLSTSILGRNGVGSYKYTWHDHSGMHHSCTVPLVKIGGDWYVKVE